VLTPYVSDELEYGWQVGISLGSLICLAGAACWLGISSSSPRVPSARPSPAPNSPP
jgi:hypothetical protein